MLETISGKKIGHVPHKADYDKLLRELGSQKAQEVRDFISTCLDQMPPDPSSGGRVFNSSHLGSQLSPWPDPLRAVYESGWTICGKNATEEEVQDYSGKMFGLLVWDCVVNRGELWRFWDPNLDPRDPNKEKTGKVYFEQVC